MAYLYGILLVLVFPLLSLMVAHLSVKHSNNTRRRIKKRRSTTRKR